MGDERGAERQPTTASRRAFLRTVGLTGLGALAAQWKPSPTYALAGGPQVVGANSRIGVGIIGCGSQGNAHIRTIQRLQQEGENIAIIAVCDVYQKRLDAAVQRTNAKPYRDYRELLHDPNVDAVFIVTPEHWHAKMAIDAMNAGKAVYLEKPMTRYLDEAKAVYETAMRTKAVIQIGSQWTSEPRWRQVGELVQQGKLGKVVWAQTSYCRNSKQGEWNYPIDPDAKPGVNLDWEMFLGPAPKRPWDPERFFRWKKFWDYTGGIVTNLFPHVLHQIFLVVGAEFPTRVVAAGGTFVHKDREIPDTFHLMAEFPSGWVLVVVGSTANERGLEVLVRGHKANLFLSGSEFVLQPERVYADEVEPMRIPAPALPNPLLAHHKNFFDHLRDRTKPLNCPIDVGYKVMVTLALAELSYRQGKMMHFDPTRQIVKA
ncbi:MAG: hypothetical protein OXFUSZZB_001160 [Candidatus Fervidibacter sp.]|jgi:predicted dehydrogenase